MAKYSYEFKKQVVDAYLSGEGGYEYLAKRYGVPSWSNIKKWVRNYETHGDKGLMRSRKQDKYSFEKTARIVHSLRGEFKLKDILAVVGFPKATYMYWQKRFDRENPDIELEEKIHEIHKRNKDYGYRRMCCLLYTSRCV